MNQQHPSIDQLVDYAHGELSAREDAAVHSHVAACPDCADAYDAEVRLTELLRGHARAEERELPPGLADAIRARVADASASAAWWTWQRLSASLRPVIAVPIAAVLVLAIYASFAIWHGSAKSDAIDAAYYIENHAALASTMPFEESSAIPATLTSDESQGQ
jgi:anti-sigma factor (TIGR02949 family)